LVTRLSLVGRGVRWDEPTQIASGLIWRSEERHRIDTLEDALQRGTCLLLSPAYLSETPSRTGWQGFTAWKQT